jgi:ribosomal protein S18 acetylase RimI-like enzyme
VNESIHFRKKFTENIIIEPLRQADIEKTAAMMSRAFAIEPNNLAVFRVERDMEMRQKPLFMRMLRSFPCITLVIKKDNAVTGALCMAKWPQCKMSLFNILKYLTGMLMIMRGGILREMRIRLIWSKHDPIEPHWHIGPIGIEPAFQGKGIGSELMNYFCESVDAEHKAAYLETDNVNNIRFYQRFGFSVTHDVVINGVRNSFMWRPAKVT